MQSGAGSDDEEQSRGSKKRMRVYEQWQGNEVRDRELFYA
jgi:hypothetical protein